MRTAPAPDLPSGSKLPPVTPSVRFTDVADGRGLRLHLEQPLHRAQVLPPAHVRGHRPHRLRRRRQASTSSSPTARGCPEYDRPDPSFHGCLLRNRGQGRFEDVTGEAGLTNVDLSFSFGVAAGDFDNDGDPDLFLANAGPNALYRNDGKGRYDGRHRGLGSRRQAGGPPLGLRRLLRLRPRRAPRPGDLPLHLLEPGRSIRCAPPRTARSTATRAPTRAFPTPSTATSATGPSRTSPRSPGSAR